MKLKVNTILKLYSALVILMFGIYASEEAEIPSLDEATTPFYEVGYSAQNTTIPNINGDDTSVADISFTEHSEILKSKIYIQYDQQRARWDKLHFFYQNDASN